MAQYKVLPTALNIRVGPGLDQKIVGTLSKNQIVEVTEVRKDSDDRSWGRHSKGWSVIQSRTAAYMQKVSSDTPPNKKTESQTIKDTKEKGDSGISTDIMVLSQNKQIYKNISSSEVKLKSLRGILGLPLQFNSTADPRIPGSSFGRMFTENIIMDMPLCHIVPGGPRFLTGKGITNKERESLAQLLADSITAEFEEVSDRLNKILGDKVARYFSFSTQYAEYMKIVRTLNNTSAIYLGINDLKSAVGRAYGTMSWETKDIESDGGTGILNWIKNHGVVTFYYNRTASGMGESASNQTTRSALDGVLNRASSLAKEAQFVANINGLEFAAMNPQNAEQAIAASTVGLTQHGPWGRLMDNLNIGVRTVISGANMMLPEIWNDSSYMRTISLDIQLVSPYGDPESFFLNIMVPINFLIALALPRQLGANGYFSPFLIQANAKGVFNCDMGIVDYISISRFGSGDAISRNGLPLEVQVSVTFRQLYNTMSVGNSDNYAQFVNNIGLLDFLANFAAINLNDIELKRKIDMFVTSKLTKITSIPANVLNIVNDRIRDAAINLLKY